MPGLRAEIVAGRIGDRRRRHAGAIHPHVADRASNAPTWWMPRRRLRAGDPPVVARIEDERLMFDLRTVLPEEEAELAALSGLPEALTRVPGKCLRRY